MAAIEEQSNRWKGVLSRLPDFELTTGDTAFVIVDMQYLDAHRDYGMGAEAKRMGNEDKFEYYINRVEKLVTPNIQRMQKACREKGVDVIFLRIASLVEDCKDVAAVHKRLELFAPVGSKEAEILDEIKPLENEAVITKGCSGVFNGTNFDQILANMGIKNLIFCGVATSYCVETSVRDAGDRNYNAILIDDACAGQTEELDRFTMETLDDVYCKVMSTDDVLKLIETMPKAAATAGAAV